MQADSVLDCKSEGATNEADDDCGNTDNGHGGVLSPLHAAAAYVLQSAGCMRLRSCATAMYAGADAMCAGDITMRARDFAVRARWRPIAADNLRSAAGGCLWNAPWRLQPGRCPRFAALI
jgi:hypothetical protein